MTIYAGTTNRIGPKIECRAEQVNYALRQCLILAAVANKHIDHSILNFPSDRISIDLIISRPVKISAKCSSYRAPGKAEPTLYHLSVFLLCFLRLVLNFGDFGNFGIFGNS